METKKTWTREEIEQLINTNDRMVERSMVVLWERQTRDEQASQTTNHHNGMGFTGWSARSGTYFAEWVQSGRRLTGKHLAKARKIAIHHAAQLTGIANGVR